MRLSYLGHHERTGLFERFEEGSQIEVQVLENNVDFSWRLVIEKDLEDGDHILMLDFSENRNLSDGCAWNALFLPVNNSYFFDGYDL